jgi:hypothetical protein
MNCDPSLWILNRSADARTRSAFLVVIFVSLTCFSDWAAGASAVGVDGATRMTVEPSSASLSGGKARLTITGLRRQAGKYAGNYQLKVVPYFFKNESGTLSIGLSDESLNKLFAGSAVNLNGSAVTAGSRKTRAVTVKVTPAGIGTAKGSLAISIATENGPLLFVTAYTLGSG